jgi:sulfur-oxidizing protein SoxX
MRYRFVGAILLTWLFYGCQETGPARGFALPEGDSERGKETFVELRCNTCHQVEGLEDELERPTASPPVDVKLGGLAMREPTDGELVTSIINANHELYPAGDSDAMVSGGESRMANYNEVITVAQMIDLVAFLHDRYETTSSE